MKRLIFEVPDETVAISMTLVRNDFVGGKIFSKLLAGESLSDGTVNKWDDSDCMEERI